TTKHALLAELAREQGIDLDLMLGIYEMGEGNTPGVGKVLEKYGLSYVPEAHCYLRVPPGAEPIERFLYEEPITIEQIGAYKNDLHKRFLHDWMARTEAVHGRSLDEVWRIREECIAALGAGDYAQPEGR